MKNRLITATSTGLNAHATQVINCMLLTTSTGLGVPAVPNKITFTNGTGISIEFNVLSQKERAEYDISTSYFTPITIATGSSFELKRSDISSDMSYITLKGVSGSISANLSIYCLDYHQE